MEVASNSAGSRLDAINHTRRGIADNRLMRPRKDQLTPAPVVQPDHETVDSGSSLSHHC